MKCASVSPDIEPTSPVAELVNMFGPNSGYSSYVGRPERGDTSPLPWTYHDALLRATWLDDGLDDILKEAADMLEMGDDMDQILLNHSN